MKIGRYIFLTLYLMFMSNLVTGAEAIPNSFPHQSATPGTTLEVVAFNAQVNPDLIELTWQLRMSGTAVQFEVERSLDDQIYEKIDIVCGNAVDSQTVKITYYEVNLPRGYYYYRLKSIGELETVGYSRAGKVDATALEQSVLAQNSPNPFNPVTDIRFRVVNSSKVSLRIYNILGQQIRTLVDTHLAPGVYTVQWDGTDNFGDAANGGIYFYQMLIGNSSETRRMILAR